MSHFEKGKRRILQISLLDFFSFSLLQFLIPTPRPWRHSGDLSRAGETLTQMLHSQPFGWLVLAAKTNDGKGGLRPAPPPPQCPEGLLVLGISTSVTPPHWIKATKVASKLLMIQEKKKRTSHYQLLLHSWSFIFLVKWQQKGSLVETHQAQEKSTLMHK